jgi:hypothetical protein
MRLLVRWLCLIMLSGLPLAWSQDRGLDAQDDEPAQFKRNEDRRARRAPRDPATLDKGASINPQLLEVVKDNTLGIRYEERDVYFQALKLAQEIPLTKQEEYAAEFREQRRLSNPRYARRKPQDFPPFVDLFQNPDEYRGRPVSLRGVLRKLTKFDPGENSFGIEEAYEGWLYTDDGQSNPAVVIFTSKPQGLPVGGDLTEEVRLTGYFLKMYGYEAQDLPRKAPLLIAGEVEWRPSPKSWVAQSLSLETYLLATLVAVALGYVIWQANRREMTGRYRPQVEADFSKLPPIEHSPIAGPSAAETDDA